MVPDYSIIQIFTNWWNLLIKNTDINTRFTIKGKVDYICTYVINVINTRDCSLSMSCWMTFLVVIFALIFSLLFFLSCPSLPCLLFYSHSICAINSDGNCIFDFCSMQKSLSSCSFSRFLLFNKTSFWKLVVVLSLHGDRYVFKTSWTEKSYNHLIVTFNVFSEWNFGQKSKYVWGTTWPLTFDSWSMQVLAPNRNQHVMETPGC